MKNVVHQFLDLIGFKNKSNSRSKEMIDYKKLWKLLVSSKEVTILHVIQFQILKAIEASDGDLKRAKKLIILYLTKSFAPILNKSKLNNGRKEYDKMYSAISKLYWRVDEILNPSISFQRCCKELPGFYERRLKRANILGAPLKSMDEEQQKMYFDILKWLMSVDGECEFLEYCNRYYVYIFVRQDISEEYQLVQSAHAAMLAGYNLANDQNNSSPYTTGRNYAFNKKSERLTPKNLYFAVIGVPDLNSLKEVYNDCLKKELILSPFIEPDIGNELTAFATSPMYVTKRGEFLKYKLLNFNII